KSITKKHLQIKQNNTQFWLQITKHGNTEHKLTVVFFYLCVAFKKTC
ncbi:hypothetical protein DOY81_002798, partial [Sarcophaga bullata]